MDKSTEQAIRDAVKELQDLLSKAWDRNAELDAEVKELKRQIANWIILWQNSRHKEDGR